MKRLALIGLVAGLGSGAVCTIDFSGGSASYIPLDEANGEITITQAGDSDVAEVRARITTRLGRTVGLERGQAVSVNSRELVGPEDGYYRQSVPAAATYTVTVNEPTRGVLLTSIASPGSFSVTSPAAGEAVSLSGFTVSWSNFDPSYSIVITLTQTIFGQETTLEFGPYVDAGSQSFAASDLVKFKQGAVLLIAVTRIHERASIEGLRTGTLSVAHSRTVAAQPSD